MGFTVRHVFVVCEGKTAKSHRNEHQRPHKQYRTVILCTNARRTYALQEIPGDAMQNVHSENIAEHAEAEGEFAIRSQTLRL